MASLQAGELPNPKVGLKLYHIYTIRSVIMWNMKTTIIDSSVKLNELNEQAIVQRTQAHFN